MFGESDAMLRVVVKDMGDHRRSLSYPLCAFAANST